MDFYTHYPRLNETKPDRQITLVLNSLTMDHLSSPTGC